MTPTRYLPMLLSRETVEFLNRTYSREFQLSQHPREAGEIRKVTAESLRRSAQRGRLP